MSPVPAYPSREKRAASLGPLLLVAGIALAPRLAMADEPVDLERYPLEPPDTSSPEATLDTFLEETTTAIQAYRAGDIHSMEVRAHRAIETMELPRPTNDAEFLGAVESSLYLLELLARVELPEASEIPGPTSEPGSLGGYWAVPHTEIEIHRIESDDGGPPEYRFSADTLARLPEFYDHVVELPAKGRFAEYAGVAERFRLRPGLEAPLVLQDAVQGLPSGWFEIAWGLPWWKWTALLLVLVAAFAAVSLLFRLGRPLDDGGTRTSGARAWVRPALIVAAATLIGYTREVAVDWIRPVGLQRDVVVGLLSVLGHAAWIWLSFVLAARVADVVIRLREMGSYALDAQLVRLVFRLVAVMVSVYILVHLTEGLGVPIGPILAGLGVGGLAVALAVRPTLENIVGGFVLFADAPVRVGEFCKFGGELGTVEAIGLRSVRVRGLNRTLITIPNSDFSQMQLINFTRRDKILLKAEVRLRYESTPEQIRTVIDRIRELLLDHPKVSPEPARVRFVGYAESSLQIEIFALVETQDWNEFLAIQEALNLRIKDIVAESGAGFALPARTVYVERGGGVNGT